MKRRYAALWVILGLTVFGTAPASAHHCQAGDDLCTHGETGGVDLMLNSMLTALGREQQAAQQARKEYWEYTSQLACSPGGILFDRDGCIGNDVRSYQCPPGEGPIVEVFRRGRTADDQLDPARGGTSTVNGVAGWDFVGRTCRGDLVPGSAAFPSIADIRQAFHNTPWAKATLGFQPEGYRTLVTLDSYFRIEWASEGFGPDEIDVVDPATMFGHRVEIRPKVDHYTYDFGDGTTQNSTSAGGTHRAQNAARSIVHAYADTGTYTARVTVHWTADYRINGGAWLDINDTVAVPQEPVTITVLRSRARLQPTDSR